MLFYYVPTIVLRKLRNISAIWNLVELVYSLRGNVQQTISRDYILRTWYHNFVEQILIIYFTDSNLCWRNRWKFYPSPFLSFSDMRSAMLIEVFQDNKIKKRSWFMASFGLVRDEISDLSKKFWHAILWGIFVCLLVSYHNLLPQMLWVKLHWLVVVLLILLLY